MSVAAVLSRSLNQYGSDEAIERLKLYGYHVRLYDVAPDFNYDVIFDTRSAGWRGWRVAMIDLDELHRPLYVEWVRKRS